MPSNGQMKSNEQRDHYVALMVNRSPEEFRMLFKYKKSDIVNKTMKWALIVNELNSLPGARYELDTWRHVWDGMRYWVRKRCQKFNDPDTKLKTMTPLEQWERGIMSLYDITVPESIMNWTGHVDQPDSKQSPVSESETDSEAEPTTPKISPTPPRLPNSKFQDAVLLHCFTAFPQMCPPSGRDDRWNRFVDILNLFGPSGTSIEWKAMINSAKSAVATATERDATWSTFEEEVAQTLQPDVFGVLINEYPTRTCHPLLQSQVEVLLYYLEHHPCMWSPDIYPDASLWPELSGLLNVLGATATMDEHKQMMVTLRKTIRSKVPNQMTTAERQLANLHQRTAARMPRSTNISRNHDMYQFCGQVIVRLSADNDATTVTTDVACDAPGPSNDIMYNCMRCLPPTHWLDIRTYEQHLDAMHYGIESVFVKIEPSDVIVEQRHPLDTLDEEAASMNIGPTMPQKRTYPNPQRPINSTARVEPTRVPFHKDDDRDVIQPEPDHDRIDGDTAAALLHCDICKQSFQGKWLLSIHMRQHVREATYTPCGVCDLLLRTPPEWQRHRAQHNIDTDTRCDECDMSFVHALHRGAHFKRAHMQPMDNQLANAWTLIETTSTSPDDLQQGEWECDQRPCRLSFDRRTELREHLVGVHGCPALRFDQAAGRVVDVLYGYTRRASQRKMYRCNMCSLQSPALSSMHHHLLLHGDQKPYMCSRCPQTFRKATELKRHRRDQHGGGAPETCFVCETCGLKFMEKRYLKKHSRLHTGERPFQCSAEGCGMAFRRSVERRTHYLAEHYEGKLAYPCQHCHRTFKLLSERMNHMRKRHADVLQNAKADRDVRKIKKKRWNPKLAKLV